MEEKKNERKRKDAKNRKRCGCKLNFGLVFLVGATWEIKAARRIVATILPVYLHLILKCHGNGERNDIYLPYNRV